jgi:hypothetical protein
MERSKSLGLLFLVVLAASSLLLIESVSAQSSTQSAPDFTLRVVDHSYDVASATITSTDPYSGKTTTTTVPGYRVENKTIEATIQNPSGATYYNFRWRGHYEDQNAPWHYYPINPNLESGYTLNSFFSVPCKASTSTYTTLSLSFIPKSIPAGGEVDVQVQALYGSFDQVGTGMIFPPPDGPSYNFAFKGDVSDWSNTQTISYGETTPAPAPTLPELSWLAVVPLLLSVFLVAVIVRYRKTALSQETFTRRL